MSLSSSASRIFGMAACGTPNTRRRTHPISGHEGKYRVNRPGCLAEAVLPWKMPGARDERVGSEPRAPPGSFRTMNNPIVAELDPPFEVIEPQHTAAPFVFNSPHSGR